MKTVRQIHVKIDQTESDLLEALVDIWGLGYSSAVRRLIREEGSRQNLFERKVPALLKY